MCVCLQLQFVLNFPVIVFSLVSPEGFHLRVFTWESWNYTYSLENTFSLVSPESFHLRDFTWKYWNYTCSLENTFSPVSPESFHLTVFSPERFHLNILKLHMFTWNYIFSNFTWEFSLEKLEMAYLFETRNSPEIKDSLHWEILNMICFLSWYSLEIIWFFLGKSHWLKDDCASKVSPERLAFPYNPDRVEPVPSTNIPIFWDLPKNCPKKRYSV